MNRFRISKYNPSFRVDGVFLNDEWTDYSDVGKVFKGKVFTEIQYLEIEKKYIDCIITLLKMVNVRQVDIVGGENMEMTRWKDVLFINIDNLEELIRDILRNKCWCRIEGKKCYVHFGFDFIGAVSSMEELMAKYEEVSYEDVKEVSKMLTLKVASILKEANHE